MEAVREQMIASPKLRLYHDQIGKILEDERKRREQFYKDITPQGKAEFINGEVIVHSPARMRHVKAIFDRAACRAALRQILQG